MPASTFPADLEVAVGNCDSHNFCDLSCFSSVRRIRSSSLVPERRKEGQVGFLCRPTRNQVQDADLPRGSRTGQSTRKRSANIKWRRSKFTGVFGMQMHIDDRLWHWSVTIAELYRGERSPVGGGCGENEHSKDGKWFLLLCPSTLPVLFSHSLA